MKENMWFYSNTISRTHVLENISKVSVFEVGTWYTNLSFSWMEEERKECWKIKKEKRNDNAEFWDIIFYTHQTDITYL